MRVINLISSLKMGGAEQCVVNFTKAALELGIDARIVLLSYEELESRAENIRKCSYVFNKARVYQIPFLLKNYINLLSYQPTILIASFWPLVVAAVLMKIISKDSSIKIVFWEHHYITRYNLVSKLLLLFSFRWIDHVIGWRGSWAPLHKLLDCKCDFIDTGNPITFPPVSRLQPRDSGHPFKVVICSRLVPSKRVIETIYSFMLSDMFCNSTLTIMGTGPLYHDLNDLINRLQLKNVYLVGYVDSPANRLSDYDLCVISSAQEGFCNVVVESLSSGTPVLTMKNGSVAEDLIRSPDCGLVLKTGSIEDFSSGLDRLSHTRTRAHHCRLTINRFESKKWAYNLLIKLDKNFLRLENLD